MKLTPLDLRPFGRDNGLETRIYVETGPRSFEKWIIAPGVTIPVEKNGWGVQQIGCRMDQTTDREHSSSYLMNIPVAGLALDSVYGGVVEFFGIIPASGELHLPLDDEDRRTEGECEWCKKHHFFTDYLPPRQDKLHAALAGKRVKITLCSNKDMTDV